MLFLFYKSKEIRRLSFYLNSDTLFETVSAAMEKSVADSTEIKRLLRNALTDKVNDREMFMEGIDYSYYYEEQLKKVRTAYPI